MNQTKRPVLKYFAVLATFLFLFFITMDTVAQARAGGGRSSGSFRSSGSSSSGGYRSTTPYRSAPSTMQPQPTSPMSPGKSFLYGLGGGLAGGMIGNMLFGGRSHAGSGWGGSGGGGFGFGDFLLLIIIGVIIYFIVKRYRAKKAMEMGGAGPNAYNSYTYNEPAYGPSSYYAPQGDPVGSGLANIAAMDPSFNETAFREAAEDMFFKIQGGWTKRDLSGVRYLLTPEMLNTFQNDINNYIANKQFNRLENVAVRQVDIVDAVQDQGQEYITVHFLASLLDYNVDETTGNVISGSSTDPVKFTEYWTFTRRVGDRGWALSAITQEQDYR